MKEIKVAELVKEILTNKPNTRNSDNALICYVINAIGDYNKKTGKGVAYNWAMPFNVILSEIERNHLPSLESVSRARRKCQELYPELRADDDVEGARLEKKVDYIKFSQQKSI